MQMWNFEPEKVYHLFIHNASINYLTCVFSTTTMHHGHGNIAELARNHGFFVVYIRLVPQLVQFPMLGSGNHGVSHEVVLSTNMHNDLHLEAT